jgi:AhpD family alkylhydroperoxidase
MTQRMDYTAAAPGGMKALGSVHGYVSQSGLPATLIDLVYLRVSHLNGCAYCIDMHSRDLIKAGMSIEKLVLVPAWKEAGTLFSDEERAALKWAEVVTQVSDTHVPDEAYAEARHVHRKAAYRPDNRDRPDERLQPLGDQLSCHAKRRGRSHVKPANTRQVRGSLR